MLYSWNFSKISWSLENIKLRKALKSPVQLASFLKIESLKCVVKKIFYKNFQSKIADYTIGTNWIVNVYSVPRH